MKIALAIAPQDAQPSAFVVFREPLDSAIGKAARLGYDGVELALATAGDVVPGEILRLLETYGLGISAVSTGRVYAEQRAWLTSPDAGVRQRAVDTLLGLVDVAAALGTTRVNIGRARGYIHEGETLAVTEARFAEGIRVVAAHAAPSGINIVLEPVNRYEINFINSVMPDGIDLVDRLAIPNLKLMPDVFHMNMEDASIAGSLVAAGARIGYVHLADSNRWAPGQGHTDFVAIIGALRSVGYDDYVTVEILPFPSAEIAAEQAITYLRTIVPRADALAPA